MGVVIPGSITQTGCGMKFAAARAVSHKVAERPRIAEKVRNREKHFQLQNSRNLRGFGAEFCVPSSGNPCDD
jgi:hypothetical protein